MRTLFQRLRGRLPKRAVRQGRVPSLGIESLESRHLLSAASLAGDLDAFGSPGGQRGFADVTYHGGPMLQNVQIQSIFDGPAWNTEANLQQQMQKTNAFLQYFVTSPYVDTLKQYNVSDGSFQGTDVVTQDPGQTISDSQIRSLIDSQIGGNHVSAPTANSLYIFFAPPGTVVTANGQSSISNFAGYHDVFTDTAGATVYYAVIPYPSGGLTSQALTNFQQETVVLSHEIAEGMTDPDTQSGWFDSRLGEVGDIAEGQVGMLGGFEVQGVWSQADGRVVIPSASSGSNIQVEGESVEALAGQAFTAVVATIHGADPSATADSFTAMINWGDGNISSGTIATDPHDASIFDVSGTNTYAHAGDFHIAVTVMDSTGAVVGTSSSRAEVHQAPPEIDADGTIVKATSGQEFTAVVATFTDANTSAKAGDFTATINWGDGTSSMGTVAVDPNGGFDVTGTHTYKSTSTPTLPFGSGNLEGFGDEAFFGHHVFLITVMIDDTVTQATATALSLAKVAPAPPAISASGVNFTAVSGQQFTDVVATFTDSNTSAMASQFTATISWGDGTTSMGTVSADSQGGFDVTGTHTYNTHGDWFDEGNPFHFPFGNRHFIVHVSITDTQTHDQGNALSLATVLPAGQNIVLTTQNITATSGTSFSGTVATFTSTDTAATASTFTATINWGDGSKTQGAVTADPKGGFDVSGTHTYTIENDNEDGDRSGAEKEHFLFSVTVQDTSTNDSATALGVATVTSGSSGTPASTGSSSSSNQVFVAQLYQDLLGRLPDVGGLAYWSNLIAQGLSRSTIATDIQQSLEYRSDVVQSIYQKMLHRQVDPTGMSAFTTMLGNGGTPEQVQQLIAGSAEYFQTRGGGQINGFLSALYADALNRDVDPTGQAVFGQDLSQGVSRGAVAAAVFGSDEFRHGLVQNDYQTYLDRQADNSGLQTFMAFLERGAGNQGIVAAIVGSDEYFQRL